MSFLLDAAFSAFKQVRIGKHAEDPEKCLYADDGQKRQGSMVLSRIELPPKSSDKTVRCVVVSDTHERHAALADLPPCDLLIHCGDIFMANRFLSHKASVKLLHDFNSWLGTVPADHKVVVAGNHDLVMERLGAAHVQSILTNAIYLENSATVLPGGLKIWGSPVSSGKSGNRAFQSREFREAAKSAALKDKDAHIVVTHSFAPDVGQIFERPKVRAFGHQHGYHGVYYSGESISKSYGPTDCLTVNGSIMNCRYYPVNFPVVVDFESSTRSPASTQL